MTRPFGSSAQPLCEPLFATDPVHPLPVHHPDLTSSRMCRRREPNFGRAWANSRIRMRMAGSSHSWCGNTTTSDSISGEPHARHSPVGNWPVTAHTSTRLRVGFRPFCKHSSSKMTLSNDRSATSCFSERFKINGLHVWDRPGLSSLSGFSGLSGLFGLSRLLGRTRPTR